MKTKFVSEKNILFRFGATAVTIYPTIYINVKKWENLSPHYKAALLVHEQVHAEQQKTAGKFWYLKYIFSKSFRLSQELAAYRAEFNFLNGKGYSPQELVYIKNKIARSLSSGVYCNMITYPDALEIVMKW